MGQGYVVALQHRGAQVCTPSTPHTYTLILQAWICFGPESENPVTLSGSINQDAVTLPCNIVGCETALTLVISDRTFISSEEATEAMSALFKAVLHLGMMNIMTHE